MNWVSVNHRWTDFKKKVNAGITYFCCFLPIKRAISECFFQSAWKCVSAIFENVFSLIVQTFLDWYFMLLSIYFFLPKAITGRRIRTMVVYRVGCYRLPYHADHFQSAPKDKYGEGSWCIAPHSQSVSCWKKELLYNVN